MNCNDCSGKILGVKGWRELAAGTSVILACYALYSFFFKQTKAELKAKFYKGKRIVITGASMGVGEQLAYDLSKFKTR